MKINSVYGLKGRIAEKFGDINIPIKLNCFDAVKEGKAFMIATDMNITRVMAEVLNRLYIQITYRTLYVCRINDRFIKNWL